MVSPDIDPLLEELKLTLAPHWPERSNILHECYQAVRPPMEPLSAPDFVAIARWRAEDYLAHLRSWSAVRYFEEKTGQDPVKLLEKPLREAWNEELMGVAWALVFKAYRRA